LIDITYRFFTSDNGTISTEIVGSGIDRDDTMIAQVIRLLEGGELSGNEISKAIGRNRKDTSECLKSMTALGIINQFPKEPKRGQRVRFSLSKTMDTDTETLD
jgi:predicted transcriptional regulator